MNPRQCMTLNIILKWMGDFDLSSFTFYKENKRDNEHLLHTYCARNTNK